MIVREAIKSDERIIGGDWTLNIVFSDPSPALTSAIPPLNRRSRVCSVVDWKKMGGLCPTWFISFTRSERGPARDYLQPGKEEGHDRVRVDEDVTNEAATEARQGRYELGVHGTVDEKKRLRGARPRTRLSGPAITPGLVHSHRSAL